MKVLFLGGPVDGEIREVEIREVAAYNWHSLPASVQIAATPEPASWTLDASEVSGRTTEVTTYVLREWRVSSIEDRWVYTTEDYDGPGPA